MIIVRLKGGLGNQLFQYAAGRQLAEKHCVPLKLDLSYLHRGENITHTKRNFELDKFNIVAEIATENEIQAMRHRRWLNFIRAVQLKERKKDIYAQFLKARKTCYLDGWFQSEKYVSPIAEQIRKELVFKEPLTDNYFIAIKEQIENTCSVSLHFRRGDYVENAKSNTFHGVCSLDYYKNAANSVAEKTKNPHFFIFSDDIRWVMRNFELNFPTVFVEKSDENLLSDFRLMSLCKHNIIANSSYSWWAAWLNENENKIVIAPEKWFANAEKQSQTTDLIPEKWHKM
jgi:hypothetical protein